MDFGRIKRRRSVGLAILIALLVLAVGRISYSDTETAGMAPANVPVPGLASSNNIKFAANGKFLVTAPFEPSTATRLGDALPFGELDNDHLLVVNIQDPSAAPVRLDLIDRQGNRYYYPSNVLYD